MQSMSKGNGKNKIAVSLEPLGGSPNEIYDLVRYIYNSSILSATPIPYFKQKSPASSVNPPKDK